MLAEVLLVLSSLADRAGVPRPLLLAMSAVEKCETLECMEPRAAELRAQADFTFAQYRDLREERLGDWHEAVMLSAPGSDWRDAAAYAAEVYTALREGVPGLLAPQDFTLPFPLGPPLLMLAANFSEGRELPIEYLVIHDMEGSYEGTQLLFLSADTQASAHFDIRGADGEITQQVPSTDTAWHAANWDLNSQSIAIEHEGFAELAFPDALYRSSAALARFITDKFAIPKDRQHVIGHYEVPDPHHPGWYGGYGHHSDPCDAWAGEPTWHNVIACRWDWDRYMALLTGAAPVVP
ncbi:MAG: N-acetylmuramoyl-L-alanine amidase [Deltaproteobacteria bacterium]|nr:MAG: N-acetylmuramoyl-L-alanine amidase [Deltaproteobacteria bacterium]